MNEGDVHSVKIFSGANRRLDLLPSMANDNSHGCLRRDLADPIQSMKKQWLPADGM
jgi:hypothetical protein